MISESQIELIDGLGHWTAGWMLRSLLLIGVAWVATLAMRRYSAAARHAVLTTGIIASLVTPLLTSTLPAWRSLPRFDGGTGVETEDVAIRPAAAAVSTPGGDVRPGERRAGLREVSPWGWGFILWAAGAVVLTFRLLLAFQGLRRLRTGAASPGPALQGSLDRLARRAGIRRPPTLIISAHAALPMTWGFWRRFILLPPAATSWPKEKRDAVLLHELAHVRRGDFITGAIAQFACAFLWPIPAAWKIARRLLDEAETACDDSVVLGKCVPPCAYAGAVLDLTAFVRASGDHPQALLAASMACRGKEKGVERRIRHILDESAPKHPVRKTALLVLGAAAAAAAIPLAAVRATDVEGEGDDEGSNGGASAPGSTPSASTGFRFKTVVLDPGHGGSDTGTKSGQLVEKELVLDLANRVRRLLVAAHVDVRVTRRGDVAVSLADRVAFANNLPNAIFVGLHFNSSQNREAHGVETYYADAQKVQNSSSADLARAVQKTLGAVADTVDRGVKKANYKVVRDSRHPAVLVDGGFMTNPNEAKKIADPNHRETLASAITKGIIVFGSNPQPTGQGSGPGDPTP